MYKGIRLEEASVFVCIYKDWYIYNVIVADIGACERIMGEKTKGDFEDQLHAEHGMLSVFFCPAMSHR